MNSRVILIIAFFLIVAGAYTAYFFYDQSQDQAINQQITQKNMQISSPSFENNQMIPKKFTCDDENINPELNFFDVPDNAQSLVLVVDDPDASIGTWTHWTVWNINPKTSSIAENSIPSETVEGITDFNTFGYMGPCPPSGKHRYFFRLYALDSMIDLASDTDVKDLNKAMESHIIDKAELIGLYSR